MRRSSRTVVLCLAMAVVLTAPIIGPARAGTMQTYIYYVAEKVPGALEMQRFAHPIHVGLVTAENLHGREYLVPRDPVTLESIFSQLAAA